MRLLLLTILSVTLSILVHTFKSKPATTVAAGEGLVIQKEWLAVNKNPLTPKEDVRPPDQTFLTYPEWFLVFSPEEQAQYFSTHTATSFPYMSHVNQIWESYHLVYNQIKDNFEYNSGYHFMIWVIGSSATVEYAIKAWYETIIGRITDTYEVATDEDRFNAKYTADYVAFIKERPWYEFDFVSQLKTLWSSTSFTGEHFVRKWERKYILTSELLVKIAYGKLIGIGTQSMYGAALPTTTVVVDGVPANSTTPFPVLKVLGDGGVMMNVPRYDRFNPSACQLSAMNCRFREIAGNNSAILLTTLVPAEMNVGYPGAQIIFTQPLASAPTTKRIAIAVPVPQLHQLLNQLMSEHAVIEHVFDY